MVTTGRVTFVSCSWEHEKVVSIPVFDILRTIDVIEKIGVDMGYSIGTYKDKVPLSPSLSDSTSLNVSMIDRLDSGLVPWDALLRRRTINPETRDP